MRNKENANLLVLQVLAYSLTANLDARVLKYL